MIRNLTNPRSPSGFSLFVISLTNLHGRHVDLHGAHVDLHGAHVGYKYYFLPSYELGYISKEVGKNLTERAREIGRMLTGLSKSLSYSLQLK